MISSGVKNSLIKVCFSSFDFVVEWRQFFVHKTSVTRRLEW